MSSSKGFEHSTDIKPRYDLSATEIEAEETKLAATLAEQFGANEDLCAVWIGPGSEFANVPRTLETPDWSDIEAIMAPHEHESMFLVMFDMRDGLNKAVRGTRLSQPTTAESNDPSSDTTGMVLIDDIINSGQGFTAEEFRQYYKEKGIDLSSCLTVETNRKYQQAERYNGLPLAQVAYVAMFNQINTKLNGNLGYIFAAVNKMSLDSFKLIDLQFEPIAGREDLRVPVSEGEFDPDYVTVALPTSPHNLEIFHSIASLGAPEFSIEL